MERCSDGARGPVGERSIRAVLGGATRRPAPFRPPAATWGDQRERLHQALREGKLSQAEQAAEQLVVLAAIDPDPEVWPAALRAHAGVVALAGDQRTALRLAAGDTSTEHAIARLYGHSIPPDSAAQADSAAQDTLVAGELIHQAWIAVQQRDRTAARSLRQRLTPLAGSLVGEADLPVTLHLARLSLVVSDLETATEQAADAVAYARRLGSPVLLAWAALTQSLVLRLTGDYAAAAAARDTAVGAGDSVGVRLPDDLPTAQRPAARLFRQERGWWVDSPLGGGQVPGLVGMHRLDRVLRAPGPVSAYDLAGTPHRPVPQRPAEPEVAVLRGRWERYRKGKQRPSEWVRLVAAVREAAGMQIPELPGSVLVPQAVGHSLRRAVTAISAVAPALADHLGVSVLTREWCFYRPAPGTGFDWVSAAELCEPASSPDIAPTARRSR